KNLRPTDERPIIAATMFGNTTECVNACREALTREGFEVLVFHATGTGGRTMESLVDEGLVDGVLDITTTEWADEVAGGVFSAGADRLSAAGRKGVPHLIVPGCVDMVNFGAMESVPEKYKVAKRNFYQWNPAVTLMRSNIEENRSMGEIFAKKANEARGPVAFLIPLRGVSILDGDGQPFCDREANKTMFEAIKSGLRNDIALVEMDRNNNDHSLNVRGTDKDDVIVIQRSQATPNLFVISINGNETRIARKAISGIYVEGRGGNDRIDLTQIAGAIDFRLEAKGGVGND